MNTLAMIKEKELRARRLYGAQHSFAASSERCDVTSAHMSPTKLVVGAI